MKTLAAAGLALTLSACDWVALAAHALTYETLADGDAGNVAAQDTIVYATLGGRGLMVVDPASGWSDTIAVPPGMQSVDDIAIDGSLLFALDARPPGHLAVFSIAMPTQPRLVGRPHAVPTGPFSGISARRGVVMVSGGTSELTVWRYDSAGMLTGPVASADFGRGQPDVLLARGDVGYISTHYWGPYFGVNAARVDASAGAVRGNGALRLAHAGFSGGGAKPANFPLELALLKDSIVLAAHGRGVSVMRATAAGLRHVGTIALDGTGVSVDVSGDTAAVAVAGRRPHVLLLRFTATDAQVVRRMALQPGTNPAGIAFSTRHIVLAARDRGILTWPR